MFIKKGILFLLIIRVVSTVCYSVESCTEIRLDKTVLSQTPVFNQKDYPNCYAQAASTLVAAEAKKKGIIPEGYVISPQAATYEFNVTENPLELLFDKSNTSSVYKAFNHVGACDQRAIEKYGYDKIEYDFVENLKLKTEKYKEIVKLSRKNKLNSLLKKDYSGVKSFFGSLMSDTQNIFNDTNELLSERIDIARWVLEKIYDFEVSPNYLPTLDEIQEVLLKGDHRSIMNLIFKKVCDNYRLKMNFSTPVTMGLMLGDDYLIPLKNKIKENIERALEKQSPSYIMVCAEIFDEEKESLLRGKQVKVPFVEDKLQHIRVGQKCSYHALVIVGRKTNSEGRCEYLVRNSWGTEENLSSPWKNNKGQYWIDSNFLSRNIIKSHNLE